MGTKCTATFIGKAVIVATIVLNSFQAIGQSKQESLTNKSVIELVKAGLDKAIIETMPKPCLKK